MNNGQAPRRPRQSKNVFTTKSGTDIRINRSLADRRRARKDAMARARAARLSGLPKNRFKRIIYSLHPKRMAAYWFSREGGLMALKIAGVGIVVGFLLLVGMFAYFRKDLPNLSDVSGKNLDGSISYYDRTGQTVLWQDYNAVKRVPVKSDQISDYLKNATIAIEDKDFYNEGAFNVRGILRAAINDARGGNVQGGSTITQQLVKLNGNWTNDRTITRKIKELILAVEMEREYSKSDILTGYLNAAPYGGIEVGAESASRDFFGKGAKDLTLGEAALLASIPQSPSTYYKYSETFDHEALIGRQHYVLDRMVEQHMITQQQADAAKKQDVVAEIKPLLPKYSGIRAPYFVLAAKEELQNTYLGKTTKIGGWKIDTTLNLDLQSLAEKAVADGLPRVKLQGGDDAALVAEDVKTGEVVAAVGGPGIDTPGYGQLNYAHSVKVSPGSTFKPYDYVSLIDKSTNVGAGSVLYDSEGPILKDGEGYKCTDKWQSKTHVGNCLVDYDVPNFPGAITLRYALGGSRNVPAVKAAMTVGTDKVVDIANGLMAKDDGYSCYTPGTDVMKATDADRVKCTPSTMIGDGAYVSLDDHVNGIASLARLGSAMKNTYIHSITDANGKNVELQKRPAKQVVRQDSAYIVNDIASDPKASYLPGSCSTTNCTGLGSFGYKFHRYNGWHFAIKTGTTNDGFDGLMASWSTQYAALAWVGYHDRNKAMTGTMETMTEPIVRNWMQGAHDKLDTKPVNWIMPTDMKTLPAYVINKKVSRNGEIVPSSSTDLYPSWYTPKANANTSATIDKVSGKLATSCTPDAAKQTSTGANANSFSVDIFVNGGSAAANTNASDDVHHCDDQKPSANLTVASNSSGSQTNICDMSGCTITATVSQGTHPLSSGQFPGQVAIAINGTNVKTFTISDTGSPQTFSFNYTPTSSGAATITATVTDSVLYTGSTSGSLTLDNTTGSGNNGADNTGNDNGNNTRNGNNRIFR